MSVDPFPDVQIGANDGAISHWRPQATGYGDKVYLPSQRQLISGQYKKGRVRLHGMALAIENPKGTHRMGFSEGVVWQNTMAAHYGDITGTKGADGDAVDCFIGPWPESKTAYVINARNTKTYAFDEHKVMLAFPSEEMAKAAYMHSYARGWLGLIDIIPATISQLKWWLKYGNTRKQLTAAQLPSITEDSIMDKVFWDEKCQPVNTTLANVMYDLRRDDLDNFMLDAVNGLRELLDGETTQVMDALIVQVARLQRQMELLQKVMNAAGNAVTVPSFQITDPVKRGSAAHVGVLFELSDGQTITVWFHAPDMTPSKLSPADSLISTRWLLNKKDITIVVASERGQELNVREVARRVMALAGKNSAAFAKANAKVSERRANIATLEATVTAKEGELSALQKQYEIAKMAKDDGGIDDVEAKQNANLKALFAPIVGSKTSFTTESGQKINARYEIRQISSLVTSHDGAMAVNAAYPAEMQPRDRARVASKMQVAGMAGKIEPARLGESADASTGAPIIGEDGVVESGNGRVIALRLAYAADGESARVYREWLLANMSKFGVSGSVAGEPILVRVREAEVDRAEFARQANSSVVSKASASEQASSDAKRISSLDGLEATDDGDFSKSLDFIRRFMISLPMTEQAEMIEADGRLSSAGYRRVQNAILAKAYGDSATLRRMTESLGNNLLNVSKALLKVAPLIASANDRIAIGALHPASLAPALMSAVEGVSTTKESGKSVEQELSQRELGDEVKYSPEAATLMLMLNANKRSPKKIAEFIQRYYDGLEAAGNPAQGSLLGESVAPTVAALLAAASPTAAAKTAMGEEAVKHGALINWVDQMVFDSAIGLSHWDDGLTDDVGNHKAVSVAYFAANTDGAKLLDKGKEGCWAVLVHASEGAPGKALPKSFDNAKEAYRHAKGTKFLMEGSFAKLVKRNPQVYGAAVDKDGAPIFDGVDLDIDIDLDSEIFDEDDEWAATPEMDDGDNKAALDGDFKGHPFRGNQYKSASRESGAAVSASMRAKHHEKKGDKKALVKAHKTAHFAHSAAAVNATGKAQKYHAKMASFHGKQSGAKLDSAVAAILDRAFSADDAAGVIVKDGATVGRVMLNQDSGAATVLVGAAGDDKVTVGGETSLIGADAAKLVTALFSAMPAAVPELAPAVAPTVDEAKQKSLAFLKAVASGVGIDYLDAGLPEQLEAAWQPYENDTEVTEAFSAALDVYQVHMLAAAGKAAAA